MTHGDSTGLEPVRRTRLYEGVLAETFHVSRASVREALRALELRGLIEGRQGGGTFVRQISADELSRSMTSALLAGKREVAELFELREMIEPAIARKAAERVTDDQLRELERIVDQQRRKVARGEPYPDEDARFHYTVAVAASNAALLRLVNVIMDLLRESRATYLQSGSRPQRSLEGHSLLLEALRAHDPDRAETIMRDHISTVAQGVLAGSPVAPPGT